MAFKDRPMRCNACGNRFFLTVREQRERAKMGMQDSAMLFCPKCKSADVEEVDVLSQGNQLVGWKSRDATESKGSATPVGSSDDGAADDEPPGGTPQSADIAARKGPARRDETTDAERSEDEDRAKPVGDRGGRHKAKQSTDRDSHRRSGDGGSRGRGGKRRGKGRGKSGGGRGRGRRGTRQTELRVRHTGTVKWFDDDRGYGFIAQEDGDEVFVHLTGLIVEGYDRLQEGTPVEYEIERTQKGPQAVDVVPLA